MIHRIKEIVRFSDTDAAGILYFGSFATYFDESFLSMLRQHGIGWNEHKSMNFLLPIIEQKTNFHKPLFFGDEVEINCFITHIGRSSFTSRHIIRRNGEADIVASGYITRVVVTYKTFEKQDIPTLLRKVLENHYHELQEVEETNIVDFLKENIELL